MSENEKQLVSLNAMVIDDSRVMRNMVMLSLQKSQLAAFEFTESGSGSEAIGKFDADKVDIIFVDWNMPGMSGIEFAREVRAMTWAHHIPIVMITSESGSEKQRKAYEKAQINCYVTKPFTVDEIRCKVGPVVEELLKKRITAAVPAPAKQDGFFSKLLSSNYGT